MKYYAAKNPKTRYSHEGIDWGEVIPFGTLNSTYLDITSIIDYDVITLKCNEDSVLPEYIKDLIITELPERIFKRISLLTPQFKKMRDTPDTHSSIFDSEFVGVVYCPRVKDKIIKEEMIAEKGYIYDSDTLISHERWQVIYNEEQQGYRLELFKWMYFNIALKIYEDLNITLDNEFNIEEINAKIESYTDPDELLEYLLSLHKYMIVTDEKNVQT